VLRYTFKTNPLKLCETVIIKKTGETNYGTKNLLWRNLSPRRQALEVSGHVLAQNEWLQVSSILLKSVLLVC